MEALRRANEEAQSDLQAELDQLTAALQEALARVSRQSSYCEEFNTRFNFSHVLFGLLKIFLDKMCCGKVFIAL